MKLLSDWFKRHLSDPQVVILAVLLIIGFVVTVVLGKMLAPVLASVVIAYLLEGLVSILERWRMPRLAAVLVVFCSFFVSLLFFILGLFPVLWAQVGQLFQQLPSMISWVQKALLHLPDRYPDFISTQEVMALTELTRSELTSLSKRILTLSVASLRSLIWILVYLFVMPLLVFFFLKDKQRLIGWITGFLPEDRRLASDVWKEVDQQIGNYVRGKFWEILIVWTVSFITFTILNLQFAMLISLFIGLSVLIPYVGATVMVIPVASMAYFQWGLSPEFAYAVIAYIIIQILDGNLLAPLLFSEVVDLHPIAIVVAILVFGGTLGFWGVFFAIPLATLVQAVIKAWPRRRENAPGKVPFEDSGIDT